MKTKSQELIIRLKKARPGDTWTIETKAERETTLNTARMLREAGVIDVKIHTASNKKGGFKAVVFSLT